MNEATNELQAVEAALARIEDGTYGICANCGNEISAERLEVVPEAVVCAKCAREMTEGETRE
jgi:RNA polymerase-binding transcription factor DksA